MIRHRAFTLLAPLLAVSLALPVAAQGVPSSPPPAEHPWPSGDDLRRQLQAIGFAFRVDRDSGDWSGWAPLATSDEASALSLDGSGSDPAVASFDFDLLADSAQGADIDGTLTAMMEVVTRLPLDSADREHLRQFVVDDLLTEPPELLEPCYDIARAALAVHVNVDTESGLARLRLAPDAASLELDAEASAEPTECAPLEPSVEGPQPGDPSSERLTIGTSNDATTMFAPSEATLEGALVTVILTFRNDSATTQSLTFETPLGADTGPVPPGEVKLIVVRQLEPGDYPFYSSADPSGMTGRIRVIEPESPDETS